MRPTATLLKLLTDDGYAFVRGAIMRPLLGAPGSLPDWPAFAASWNDLELDQYLEDHARFRRRRHAVYTASADGRITREPHQPHYQSREYNALFGGIERWFAPVVPEMGAGASLLTILSFCRTLFGDLAPSVNQWRMEVHQFRIEAGPGQPGLPTPEGVHRDGVDFVLVLLVERRNVASGTTTVYDRDRRGLGSFTLTDPFDAALVDDTRVYHGVTPVIPLDPAKPAYRDVLVVTCQRQ
ncbi:MAG: 2OG-Fe dioxygenase family protein [Vicinamibacterales bacterium]